MKPPKRLVPLIEEGLVDDVLSQLMSGKEANVYVVRCGGEVRAAKVYKEAEQRSFRQAVEYREGRGVKGSRRARAMEKGSRFGRKEVESAWQTAEVQALYRLAAAGVRVPKAHGFFEGVGLGGIHHFFGGDVSFGACSGHGRMQCVRGKISVFQFSVFSGR